MFGRTAFPFLMWLCLISVAGTRGATAQHLVFCYDPYPPYTIDTPGAPLTGSKVELLDAVVGQIEGVTAEVILLPWKRCHAEARAGNVDGILPLFKNEERTSYLAFTQNTFNETNEFWYNTAAFPEGLTWEGDFEAISHLRLGMLNGSYIDQEMQNAFESHQEIQRVGDVTSLFKMLQFDRVQLVAIGLAVGQYYRGVNGLENQIQPLPRSISSKPSYFGLSRASGADALLEQFNAAIQTLHDDGTIAAIFDQD